MRFKRMPQNKKVYNLSFTKATIFAGVFYSIIIFIANWPILIGTNFMKFDIWDAYYPLEVITSDVIKSGSIPLWTPLMNMGTPLYAMVGIPVWYPSTILLDIIGFTPVSLAFDYCFHILMGSVGMFLLVIDPTDIVDKKNINRIEYITALCAGLLYGFSGVFLSNAQHIMIIISAAWVPYSLYYSKKLAKNRKLVDAMSCALFTSLIFLGGYPEVFYNLFLIMIPWMIHWALSEFCHHSAKETIRILFRSLLQLLEIAVFTVACSAITLIPFVKIIPQITRGGGQDPMSPPLIDMLSMLLPVGIDKISGFEISMGLFYMGFLTVTAIPLAIRKIRKGNHLLFYFTMFLITLYACFGKKSLIHILLYRFAPMYSSFRFPTLFRIFCCIFAIFFVKDVWLEFINGELDKKTFFANAKFLLILSLGISAFTLTRYIFFQTEDNYKSVIYSSAILTMFSIIYILIFSLNNHYKWNCNTRGHVFIILVIAEVIVVHAESFPFTIAKYDYLSYFADENVKNDINNLKEEYRSRNKNCNFKNNERSNSTLNSGYIAFNKTFDEEGYLSVKLSKTDSYKNTYNRSIIQQQPEIFFTDDVVSEDDVKLSQWLNMPNSSPNEIHIGTIDNQLKNTNSKEYIEPKVVEEDELQTVETEGGVKAIGPFMADSEHAVKIRLYFSGENQQEKELNVSFKDGSNNFSNYKGSHIVRSNGNQKYVDISFPSCDVNYSTVEISGDSLPTSISLVKLERATTDSHIDVNEFGCNKISMNVNAPTDGIVTVLQSNYDGWNVLVDGKKTDITEVDGCFIGIPVTKGTHDVELEFRPLDFVIGAAITFAYLVLFIIVLIIDKRKTVKLVCSQNNINANRG